MERTRLAELLADRFGVSCDGLSFLPAGETAWCYLASGAQGRYLVKLHPAGSFPIGPSLGAWLAAHGIPVPRAVPTADGRWSASCQGLPVTVSEYVEAELFDAEIFSPETARRLAAVLARLHAIPVPRFLRLPVEGFATYARELEPCLAQLRTGGPALGQAAATVLPHADRLLRARDELDRLARRCRRRRTKRVLTHGDLIPGNVLQDGAGSLWLIDWDHAAVGPRERDLVFLADAGSAPAAASYRELVGGFRPDAQQVAFFVLRRAFDDIMDWLLPVVRGEVDAQQARANLGGIGWVLSRWDELALRIARLT